MRKDTSGVGSPIGNIIWLVLCGWELALAHLITGIAQCITIIGIPLGLANFKLIPVSLWPLGRRSSPSTRRAGWGTRASASRLSGLGRKS